MGEKSIPKNGKGVKTINLYDCVHKHVHLSFIFSFIIDEDINRNITISPVPERGGHVYLSVAHKVNIHVQTASQDSRFLLHYKGECIIARQESYNIKIS